MRFAVETWDPSYGSATESLDLELSATDVDPTVELPVDRWAPIPCAGFEPGLVSRAGSPIWFVDGVRRIDARVWIADDASGSKPGVCASVAAGSVRVADGTAEVVEVLMARGLYTTPDAAGPILTTAGTYQLRGTSETTPEAAYLAIHQHMTELELCAAERAERDDLVVVDGPLRGRTRDRIVGYVKTQHVQYLAGEAASVLARLEPGDRTPLFLLGGRQTRYAWYLRLRGERTHPLACIVRCETPAIGDVVRAAALANEVTQVLLGFASEPHKDARAPQNLYPIAGLEHRLRHLLGDAQLLERALRAASHHGAG